MSTTFTALLEAANQDAVATPRLLEQFVELFAAAPARINALSNKGIIAPGYDADLVVFDPHESRTVTADILHMGTDFSPFDGLSLRGWPQVVVTRGRVVFDEAGFHDPGAIGHIIEQCRYRGSRLSSTARSVVATNTGSC